MFQLNVVQLLFCYVLFSTQALYPICSSAQKFEWGYGYGGFLVEEATCLANDKMGNTFVGGFFTSPTDFDPGSGIEVRDADRTADVFILKLDSTGNLLWLSVLPSTNDANKLYANVIHSMAVDKNGDVIICGQFKEPVDFDPGPGQLIVSPLSDLWEDTYFLKLRGQNGNLDWFKRIGSPSGFILPKGLVLDSKDNIYSVVEVRSASGTAVDVDPGPGEFWVNADSQRFSTAVLKLDKAGNTVWAYENNNKRQFDPSPYNRPQAIAIDRWDQIYIGGSFIDSIDFDPGPGKHYLNGTKRQHCYIQMIDENANLLDLQFFQFKGSSNTFFMMPDQNGRLHLTAPNRGTTYDNGNSYKNVFYFDNDSIVYDCYANFDHPDILMIEFDEDLRPKSSYYMGASRKVEPFGLFFDNLNNLFLFGRFAGKVSFDSKRHYNDSENKHTLEFQWDDGFICKLAQNKQPLWAQKLRAREDSLNSYGFVDPHGGGIFGKYVYLGGEFKGKIDLDPSQGKAIYSSTNGDVQESMDYQAFHLSWQDTCSRASQAAGTINITTCDSFLLPGGQIAKNSGKYKGIIGGNQYGCDSIQEYNVVIESVDTRVTKSGNTLTAVESGASYQWLDCNDNFREISGATSRSFTYTKEGSYGVRIKKNSCDRISECIETSSGIIELERVRGIFSYPNPFSKELIIEFDQPLDQTLDFKLFDVTGRLARLVHLDPHIRTVKIETSDLPQGLYVYILEDRQLVIFSEKILKVDNFENVR